MRTQVTPQSFMTSRATHELHDHHWLLSEALKQDPDSEKLKRVLAHIDREILRRAHRAATSIDSLEMKS